MKVIRTDSGNLSTPYSLMHPIIFAKVLLSKPFMKNQKNVVSFFGLILTGKISSPVFGIHK